MTYNEAKEYLKAASAKGSILGLERVVELLHLMGDPQEKVKVIHVAGTNGKGSFGAMMTSVLREAGYKTGGFSSPAITDITDSYRINGTEISHEKFTELIGWAAELCEKMDEKPTEFEIMAAAAYELFYREGCDIAVIECGMGGDTDATNVINKPVLSVITNVQSDHCKFLGNTIAEIAAHKAGIIKEGCPVFFGGDDAEAFEVVSAKAREVGAPFRFMDYSDVSGVRFSLDGMEFDYKDKLYKVPLLGVYQLNNALNVIFCSEILTKKGYNIDYGDIRRGLAKTEWHGRFEMLRRDPYVIFDGAHNPDGVRFASESIERYFGRKKVAMLIGVMADKDYRLYSEMLGNHAAKVFTVKPDNPRALDSASLAKVFSEKNISAESFDVLADGVKAAYEYAKSRNIPLIALGSLYMYREFNEVLRSL
ncbi:MAG TPA: folylpolyglutamate synthase/dihydrofolate synthase family protein [Ruminococcus flavefaciens]|nr:folylpolyglutamate synthase/dihydrofolate synthase family protein [Ruminococcus flavefaciens]HQM00936.1 folylpolyglutamate synthase/dihydrofolate synthase family protein [Ruminococcus flavefaciens]